MAEFICDAILSGAFPEESQAPSITEIALNYKINPATSLKGINLLVDAGILYKKRGLGMFVREGAAQAIRDKRREDFYGKFITLLAEEARKLGLGKNEIHPMVDKAFNEIERNEIQYAK